MTTVVLDTLRTVMVTDQGIITRVTVAQAGVQGPQGDPTTVNGKTGTSITLTASDVGAIATTARGAINGVAELDGSGLVPIAELPVAGLAGDFVDLSTNQTIATGIKTFSVSPVVPTPTTGTQAANKTYVDLKLPLTGGTMSGAIAMGTSKITGVGNGSAPQDVVAFVQLPSSTNLVPITSGGTGSTTKNFVDITTAQTVAGVKSFSSPPTGPTPVGSTDLVNKAYADAIAAGLQPKPSASLATAAALPTNTYSNGSSGVGATLTGVATGVLTIDGTAVTLGMTILVKNEVASANNGLYTCTVAGAVGVAYVLTRSVDMNTSTEFPGAYSYVESGTANVGSQWAVSGLGPFTIGTTAVPYVQVGGPGSTSAGTGLTLTGSVMSLTNPVSVALGGTGSATQNFVDISTTQVSIAGAKTFTGTHTASGISYVGTTLGVGSTSTLGDNGVGEIQLHNAGTVPSTNPTGGGVLYANQAVPTWRDSGGKTLGMVRTYAGRATGLLTSFTTEADIPGATVSVVVTGSNATLEVNCTWDMNCGGAAATMLGFFNWNTVDQAAQGVFIATGAGQRACVSQTYLITGITAGTYTAKLRASSTVSNASNQAGGTHTGFSVTLIDQ